MIVAFSIISKPVAFQYVNCIYTVYGIMKLCSSWFYLWCQSWNQYW